MNLYPTNLSLASEQTKSTQEDRIPDALTAMRDTIMAREKILQDAKGKKELWMSAILDSYQGAVNKGWTNCTCTFPINEHMWDYGMYPVLSEVVEMWQAKKYKCSVQWSNNKAYFKLGWGQWKTKALNINEQ